MHRIMNRAMIDSLNLRIGDRVQVTVNEPRYSQVGDTAILTRCDEDGDWWGDIEGGEEDVCLTDVGAILPAPRIFTASETLLGYLCHLSLSCHQGCNCGLDELTDAAGVQRTNRFPG